MCVRAVFRAVLSVGSRQKSRGVGIHSVFLLDEKRKKNKKLRQQRQRRATAASSRRTRSPLPRKGAFSSESSAICRALRSIPAVILFASCGAAVPHPSPYALGQPAIPNCNSRCSTGVGEAHVRWRRPGIVSNTVPHGRNSLALGQAVRPARRCRA